MEEHLFTLGQEIRMICENWLDYVRKQFSLRKLRSPRAQTPGPAGRRKLQTQTARHPPSPWHARLFISKLKQRSRTLSPRCPILDVVDEKTSSRSPTVQSSSRRSKHHGILRKNDTQRRRSKSSGTKKTKIIDQNAMQMEEKLFEPENSTNCCQQTPQDDHLPSSPDAEVEQPSSNPPDYTPADTNPDCSTVQLVQLDATCLSKLPAPQPNPDRLPGMPPVECPVVVRAWLNIMMSRGRGIERGTFSGVRQNETRGGSWNPVLSLGRGCVCSRLELPEVTDIELDVFLQRVIPPEQAVVMVVVDSRDPQSFQTDLYRFIQEQFVAQQHSPPCAAALRSPRTVMGSRNQSVQQQDHNNCGVAGTGACATIATRLAHYRFVTYDLHQTHGVSQSDAKDAHSLLLQRHGGRPRVGDALIFLRGQLSHIGPSFSGYCGDIFSRRQLERRIMQCRHAVLNRGFTLPIDFRLP